MKATTVVQPGFEGMSVRSTPARSVPAPAVRATDDSITLAAGAALWGPLLDRLNLGAEADRRKVRPIGPGGYGGGECYRAGVETLLAGGDFISDRSLLADEATARLRGDRALPSHTTQWRFFDEADLGRVARLAAVNREMLRRAWAAGAQPTGPRLTIDPDATIVRTYGKAKQGSTFTYKGTPGLHPLLGVIGETGEILGVRARKGSAHPGRALGSFTTECIRAIPAEVRGRFELWVRSDSAGYQKNVIDAAEAAGATWSVTAKQFPNVREAIEALATDPETTWTKAAGVEEARGSEVAEAPFAFAKRTVRLIVRRQPKDPGDQLSFDDVGAFRFQAVITNAPASMSAVDVEAHHRLRGGIPEGTIKGLKGSTGFRHAPLANFFGNWCWWLASVLAWNLVMWLQVLALPAGLRFAGDKRLRLQWLNAAARVTTSGRRLWLNFPRSRSLGFIRAFREALRRVRALPAFA